MGAVQSSNDNIDDFVDYLVENNHISTPLIEKVFRAVDRANYFHHKYRDRAYRDLAWKYEHLHLSAPNVYCKVMQALKLERGLSFLNLGSGTGYLSTMAGLILGPYGINHGIELHNDCVQYAFERLDEFTLKSEMFGEFEFCEPKFVIGNCLQINSDGRLYDRVYCGAGCPAEYEDYMKNLINVGGILVMPLNDQLLQIHRTSETSWETNNIASAQFLSLILPTIEGQAENVDLPEFNLPSLQDVARFTIRSILHEKTLKEYPHLRNYHGSEGKASRHERDIRQKEMLARLFDDDWEDYGPNHPHHKDDADIDNDDNDQYFPDAIPCPIDGKRNRSKRGISKQALSDGTERQDLPISLHSQSGKTEAEYVDLSSSPLNKLPRYSESILNRQTHGTNEKVEERKSDSATNIWISSITDNNSRKRSNEKVSDCVDKLVCAEGNNSKPRSLRHQLTSRNHFTASHVKRSNVNVSNDIDKPDSAEGNYITPRSLRGKLVASGLITASDVTAEASGISNRCDHNETGSNKDSLTYNKEFIEAYSKFWGKVCKYAHEVQSTNSRRTISMYLQEYIKQLPLPLALRSFLMYYRD